MYHGLGHDGAITTTERKRLLEPVLLVLGLVTVALIVAFLPLLDSSSAKHNNLQPPKQHLPALPESKYNGTLLDRVRAGEFWRERTQEESKHPQVAFIQSVLPESITFSLGLDNAAFQYDVKTSAVREVDNRHDTFAPQQCIDKFAGAGDVRADLWFHGGFKHDWMAQCIEQVKFITLLGNPLEQTLRQEADAISQDFYSHYSAYNCSIAQPRAFIHPIDQPYSETTEKGFDLIEYCVDKDLRYNLTMVALAKAVEDIPPQSAGTAIDISTAWAIGPHDNKKTNLTRYLMDNYYVVGTRERFDEFLVLIAMDNGWDPSLFYYHSCKPYEREITLEAFKKAFPKQYTKLKQGSKPAYEAWQWATMQFDALLKELGDKFQIALREFKIGLEDFRLSNVKRHALAWEVRRYRDGETDIC